MDGLGYACALLLAAAFVRAGAAKLARPAAAAAGFAALGVPAPGALSRTVPVVELLAAVALVGAPRIGGAASLCLLVGFSVVIGRALRAGAVAPCNCFGAAHADPVSAVDLVRNALLAGLAVVAVVGAGAGPTVPGPPAAAAVAVGFGAGLAVLGGLRRSGRSHAEPDAP